MQFKLLMKEPESTEVAIYVYSLHHEKPAGKSF